MRTYLRLVKYRGETCLEKVEAQLTQREFRRRKKRRKAAYRSRRINRLILDHKRH